MLVQADGAQAPGHFGVEIRRGLDLAKGLVGTLKVLSIKQVLYRNEVWPRSPIGGLGQTEEFGQARLGPTVLQTE